MRPAGIYRIRNRAAGKSLVGMSADITSVLNRHRFQLGNSDLSAFPVRHPPSDWPDVLRFSVHEVQGKCEERSALRLDS